ncbi:MAG: 50S ribosomal protein L11 methyltransferase [Rikenellaceae bacterium]|nr:50S ribosomal protein L11 methyltransferase [Rikenellaceae bacterium]
MDFIEITVPCMDTEDAEILMARLSDFPFEGFEAADTALKAYISAPALEEHLHGVTAVLRATGAKCTFETIAHRNWNAEWESSFSPVDAGRVTVRAPFHPAPSPERIDIVVMPKMSFGTGHHATTRLMILNMEEVTFAGRTVLDMGSGTGILSILAARMGAAAVDAVDTDRWAFENCTENIAENGVSDRVRPVLGDASSVEGNIYEVILANINRNILVRDMGAYARALAAGGVLILSGILSPDLEHVDRAAAAEGLGRYGVKYEEDWCSALYRPAKYLS